MPRSAKALVKGFGHWLSLPVIEFGQNHFVLGRFSLECRASNDPSNRLVQDQWFVFEAITLPDGIDEEAHIHTVGIYTRVLDALKSIEELVRKDAYDRLDASKMAKFAGI